MHGAALVVAAVGAEGRRAVVAAGRVGRAHDHQQVVAVDDHVRVREVAPEGQVVVQDAGLGVTNAWQIG